MKKGLKIFSLTLLLASLVACNSETSNISSSSISSTSSSPTSITSSNSSSSESSSSIDENLVTKTTELIAKDVANLDLTQDQELNSTFKILAGKGSLTFESGSRKATNLKGETIDTGGRIKSFKQSNNQYLQITVTGKNAKLHLAVQPSNSNSRDFILTDENNAVIDSRANPQGSSSIFEYDLNLEPGVYKYTGSDNIHICYAGLQEDVNLGKEIGFSIQTETVEKDYFVGEEVSTAGLIVEANYDNGAKLNIDSKDYQIDLSNVKSEPGTYPVIIKYKDYSVQQYEVTIHQFSELAVYSDFTISNKKALRFPKVYILNSQIDTSNIIVKAKDGDFEKKLDNPTFSEVKTSSAGAKQLVITGKIGMISQTSSIKLTVIDPAKLTPNSQGEYKVRVSSSSQNGFIDKDKIINFNKIQDAHDFLKACNLDDSTKKVIEIADGTYKEKLYIEIPNVSLVGNIDNPNNVNINYDLASYDKDANNNNVSTYGSSSVTVVEGATNFSASGITFENSKYKSMEEYNSDSNSDKQACAIVVDDDAIFNNCNFIGFQDTLYARLGNQMYYQCKIQGMTDFIFGEDSNVYLNSCDITCLNRNSSTNGGYICTSKPSVKPQVGFFFESCNIVGEQGVTPGTVSLARPWGNLSKITYANCNMDASISKKAYNDNVDNKNPRFDDMSSNLPQNADFSEYNNKGEGAITQAVLGGKILTQEEYNSLNGLVINLFSSLTD